MIRDALPGDGGDDDRDAIPSYRPALQRLALDTMALVEGDEGAGIPGLEGGFATAEELVEWEQRLAIRALGQVPQVVFQGVASQLATAHDRPLVQALLDADEMGAEVAQEWRRRFRKRVVHESFDAAYRELRGEVTEYVDDAGADDDHDPVRQRYLAMRPGLEELDEWQRRSLGALFSGELREDGAIMEWATMLENACYGERIRFPGEDDDVPVGRFLADLDDRDAFVDLLTAPAYDRPRAVFAARFLIPTFNAATREMLSSTGEMPSVEREPQGVTQI